MGTLLRTNSNEILHLWISVYSCHNSRPFASCLPSEVLRKCLRIILFNFFGFGERAIRAPFGKSWFSSFPTNLGRQFGIPINPRSIRCDPSPQPRDGVKSQIFVTSIHCVQTYKYICVFIFSIEHTHLSSTPNCMCHTCTVCYMKNTLISCGLLYTGEKDVLFIFPYMNLISNKHLKNIYISHISTELICWWVQYQSSD